MASVIKIKNSTGSGANTGAPNNLAQGEMAYSFSNNTLVIGTATSGTNVIIGGAAYVGNYNPTTSTLQNISNIFGLSSTPLVIKGTNSQVVNIGSTGVDTSILGTLSVLQTANISALAVTNGATFSGVTSFSYANGIGFKDVNDTATSGASPSYFIRPSTTDLTTATGIKTFFLPIIAGTTTTTNDSLVSATSTDILTNKTWNGVAIAATYGGTGLTSYAVGDLLYAGTTTSLTTRAAVATGSVLLSAGTNVAPVWGQVSLTGAVTGTLPPGNGGTGVANNVASTITISGAFATTLTVGATTTLTLPATGTLATLAGSETFTNKNSYNGLVITANSGVITTGTWNGTVIGASYLPALVAASGTIGLTAVSGSATTAMRSDSTPALSQAIAPTWTAQHIFSNYAPQCSVAPTGDTQLVNKLYVDTVAQGLHVHPPADVILLADLATTVTGESTFVYASPTASTTTITITGTAMTFTVDSVLMANWTRIVIAGESSTTASTSVPNKEWHGIYTKSTSTTTSIVLTRAADAEYVSELNGGDFIFIQSGTIYADTGFVQTVSSALGAIAFASANGFYPTFVQFSQAGVIAAGNGLEKSGVALAVKALDSSITVASGGISVGTIDGGSF